MSTMRAVVLDAPGPPEALHIRVLPVPVPRPGEVLIKVEAFGLDRSELHTRLGLAQGVTFPRVLGIEATGTVADCPAGAMSSGPSAGGHHDGRHGPHLRRAVTPNTAASQPCRWCRSPAPSTGRCWARSPRCCRPLTAR